MCSFTGCLLSCIYTGDKTLHVVAVASGGDLKSWEDLALRNFPVRKNPERNNPESRKNPKH